MAQTYPPSDLGMTRAGGGGVVAAGVAGVLLVVTVLAGVMPWCALGVRLASQRTEGGGEASSLVSPQVIVNTGGYVVLIAAASTLLGLPAARVIAGLTEARRRGAGMAWFGVIGSILLLPSYLPYAGWGILRGPNTYLGDFLARQDPHVGVVAARVAAVLGMVLWCWPLSALVLGLHIRTLNSGVVDALRMDAPSLGRRWVQIVWLVRRGVVASAACVGLVVLGSAIPLHVAQVPIYAIELWKAMMLGKAMTAIWMAASPLLLLAGVSAAVIARMVVVRSAEDPSTPEAAGAAPVWARVGTLGAWAMSVLVPLGLFAWSVRSWRSVPMFWRLSGRSVAESAGTGAWVGLGVVGVGVGTWMCVSDGRWWTRRAAVVALVAFLFCGLAPGVLMGTAVAGAWTGVGHVRDVGLIVVLTHLARFGFVGVLLGWWLAKAESREEGWMRRLDAGRSASGWARTRLAPGVAIVLGLWLCAAALSFHEIESTVMVAPPGGQSLAQQLLDYLHYARDEQLSAAAVNLLSIGLVVAMIGAGLMSVGATRARRAGRLR